MRLRTSGHFVLGVWLAQSTCGLPAQVSLYLYIYVPEYDYGVHRVFKDCSDSAAGPSAGVRIQSHFRRADRAVDSDGVLFAGRHEWNLRLLSNQPDSCAWENDT